MEARELRIGNLICTRFGTSKVQALTADDVIETEDGVMFGHIPIPLTKEWLRKFGFNEDDYAMEFNLNGLWLDCEYTQKDEWIIYLDTTTKDDTYNHHFYFNHIQYVHQLQNLYFALTGKELIYES